MMNLLRRTALAALWLLAGVGVLCGASWAATSAGLIKPLVVISGSMEPEITTGDLLIGVPVATSSLRPGDVVSVPSPLTGSVVTHRVQEVKTDTAGGMLLTLKGDSNEFSDAVDYSVNDSVWRPALQLPGWGTAMMRLASASVALPLLCGLLGLVGLALLLPPPSRPTSGRVPAVPVGSQ